MAPDRPFATQSNAIQRSACPPGMPLGGVGEGVNVGAGPVGVLVGGFPAAAAGLDIGAETNRANNIVTVASTAKNLRIP